MNRIVCAMAVALATAAAISGCGSSGSSSSGSLGAGGSGTSSSAASGGGTNAAAAEAQSAAAGDIPDNQVYLRFRDAAAGYSILYPEGWTRSGGGNEIGFTDKSNLLRIKVLRAPAPSSASLAAELGRLKASNPMLSFGPSATTQLKSGPAVKATYTTTSAPNSVTGKRIVLVVDRYELGRAGKLATIDLGHAKGVDTVDAYRMIINSFRWQ
jgi:hypothetical protein